MCVSYSSLSHVFNLAHTVYTSLEAGKYIRYARLPGNIGRETLSQHLRLHISRKNWHGLCQMPQNKCLCGPPCCQVLRMIYITWNCFPRLWIPATELKLKWDSVCVCVCVCACVCVCVCVVFHYQAGGRDSWTCRWCCDIEESRGPVAHPPSSPPSSGRSLSPPLPGTYLYSHIHIHTHTHWISWAQWNYTTYGLLGYKYSMPALWICSRCQNSLTPSLKWGVLCVCDSPLLGTKCTLMMSNIKHACKQSHLFV